MRWKTGQHPNTLSPAVVGLLQFTAIVFLTLVFAAAYTQAPDPMRSHQKLGEAQPKERGTLKEKRGTFVYTSDRDETLGELQERFTLMNVDMICRDLWDLDSVDPCPEGWQRKPIRRGQSITMNVQLLHSQ
jgi:hypothetical protein